MTDSYGGCVFCAYKNDYHEYEQRNAELESTLAAEIAKREAAERDTTWQDHADFWQKRAIAAELRASDAAAVAYERAAKVVAGAAPGFCGGKAETVLYTIAAELRALIPDAARVEAVLRDSERLDAERMRMADALREIIDTYSDTDNLQAAYMKVIAVRAFTKPIDAAIDAAMNGENS